MECTCGIKTCPVTVETGRESRPPVDGPDEETVRKASHTESSEQQSLLLTQTGRPRTRLSADSVLSVTAIDRLPEFVRGSDHVLECGGHLIALSRLQPAVRVDPGTLGWDAIGGFPHQLDHLLAVRSVG